MPRAQVGERLAARSDRFATIDHDRAQAGLDQLKRSEGPGRASTDHQHLIAAAAGVGSPVFKGLCAGSVLDAQTPSGSPRPRRSAPFEQPDGATATWVSGGLEELVQALLAACLCPVPGEVVTDRHGDFKDLAVAHTEWILCLDQGNQKAHRAPVVNDAKGALIGVLKRSGDAGTSPDHPVRCLWSQTSIDLRTSSLAGLIVGIVGMLVLPLPTFILDLLLTLNITLALTMLLVAVYMPNALKLSSFPTILLVTTLFRLALNVSSTRLILLDADAGDVIAAFGNFVVAGNFVVGAVIFLILTLIQFLVIAKGSERVAEVAARFTLDAMPASR